METENNCPNCGLPLETNALQGLCAQCLIRAGWPTVDKTASDGEQGGFVPPEIDDLAALFPDLANDLNAIIGRLFDLHPLTRVNYYHPDMKGSWSIKAVLPTLATDLDYGALGEIQEGTAASEAFLEMMQASTGEDRRRALRDDLLAYCKLDTLALVELTRALARVPG